MDGSISKQRYNVFVLAFSFGLIAVALGLLAILFSYKQVLDIQDKRAQLQAAVRALETELDSLSSRRVALVDSVSEKVIPPVAEKQETAADTKPAEAVATEKPKVAQTTVSTKGAKSTTAKVAPREVVLTYYHRKADNASLLAALQALDLRFEEKVLDKNTGYEKTNCIWYGAGVPASEVKKVAIAIIQSGNPIKGIKRFGPSYKNPSYKRNIIEVGREENYEKYYTRPMSIYEVQVAKL
ncbi:MAG TPA: hypothetical protein VIN07_04745 [Flavipsychrobacter sp.]